MGAPSSPPSLRGNPKGEDSLGYCTGREDVKNPLGAQENQNGSRKRTEPLLNWVKRRQLSRSMHFRRDDTREDLPLQKSARHRLHSHGKSDMSSEFFRASEKNSLPGSRGKRKSKRKEEGGSVRPRANKKKGKLADRDQVRQDLSHCYDPTQTCHLQGVGKDRKNPGWELHEKTVGRDGRDGTHLRHPKGLKEKRKKRFAAQRENPGT